MSDVASLISCPYLIQLELIVGLPTLVVGTMTDPSLSVVMTDVSPRLMKFGFWVKTELFPDFITQRELTSTLELSEIFNQLPYWKSVKDLYCLQKSINGTFEFLSVPDALRTKGPYWIYILLVPIPVWGVSGTMTNSNWVSLPGGLYDVVSVPWHAAVPACPAYLPRSPENILATSHRNCDNLLWENRLARVQSLSNFCHIFRDRLIDQTDFAWDDLWDDPVEAYFVWRIYFASVSISDFPFVSVTSVSS